MALTTVKSDQIQTSVALAGSPTTTTQSASDNSTKVATTAYVETAVANLVASAPAALNTLDELAAALNDDASFSTTITNSIATKLPLAGGALTGNLTTNSRVAIGQSSVTGGNVLLDLHGSGSGVGAQSAYYNDHNTSGFFVGLAGNVTGNPIIYNVPDTNIEFYTNNAIAMTIASSGTTFAGALTINANGPLTLNGTDPLINLQNGGSNHWQLGFENTQSDRFVIYDNNASSYRLIIDSSGNTTFAGTGTFAGGATNNNDDANILTLNASQHARLLVDTSSVAGHRATLALESNGNELTLATTGSASYLGSVGDLEITGGNVGIGITPTKKLTVFGTGAGNATVQIEGEGGADPYINFLANNTQHWSVGIDDSDSDKFKISKHSALGTNDYFTINTSGSVGINETNPSGKLQITDGNNYAKFGDFHSNSTMTLQMADSAGFPVEMQAYSSELRFNTTPTSGATPVARMHIQNDGHIRVNPGAADYDGHTNVDQHLFTVQTSYNANGDQNLNIVNHDGNWQDGTSGADSAFGLMWGYQNNIRAGIHYDHRGTEKFDFYSGYGAMRFRVRNSVAANQSPIGSETIMPEALTIIPGGNVGIGTSAPYTKLQVEGTVSDTYTPTAFLDKQQIRIRHPNAVNNYGGIGFTNSAGNYEWFVGANQTSASPAIADFVIQGADSTSGYTENMRIDCGGHVTMPKQPYVQGRGSGGWTAFSSSGTWELQPHGSTPVTSVDRNSDYSTSNKRFTCPVDGVYLVCASWYIYQTAAASAGGQYLHPSVYKNGGLAWNSSMQPYTIYGYEIDRSGVNSKHYDGVQMTYTIYCSANDYLDIRCYTPNASTLSYENYFYFSYTLLS